MTTVAPTLEAFFTERLARQREASRHTVAAYRDTFRLLLTYVQQSRQKAPSALDFVDLDAGVVGDFLNHIEVSRGNGAPTRNARLAAIHSFFCFAARLHPEHAALIQRVLAIPHKRLARPLVSFLSRSEVEGILGVPDRSTWTGRRDHALLLLAVQAGLRLSEVTSLTRQDLHLGSGAYVRCHGKGRICRMQHMRPYVAARTMSRSGDGTPQPGGDRLCSLDICRVLFEALEEGEQRVGRPVAAGLGVRWCESIQGAPLEVHVGVDVLVGRLESLVAEPQGDRRHVHRCRGLEESHRRGVAEHMGSDALAR